MEYHSGGSLPLLGRPRYCPGANANGGYLCETGHCCGETGCCTYYYELWWFWLLWTVLILFSCCCAYRHRRAKLRVQQQQRQREISLLAYHGASSYPSSMLDLSFLASLKLPSYEEVAAQPSTPPPPYSSVFTTPRYPQPPRTVDPHLLTQHGPLLHRPLSDGPSSLSSDNSSSCSCDSCCPSSPCSSSLSAPVTYETDTSHASTPSEAVPLNLDVTMETITAAASCLEANESRRRSGRMDTAVVVDIDDAGGVQEPVDLDSLLPNQTVTVVAVVTGATSPLPTPSPGSEAVLPVGAASPTMRQLDLTLCSPMVSTRSSSALPSPSAADTVLPSIQISIEGPAETTTAPKTTSVSDPSTPTETTSDRPKTKLETNDLERTFGTNNVPSSPNSVLSPDVGRTLALVSDSSGVPTRDPNLSLVPILAPLNHTPVLGPVSSNLTHGPDPVPTDLTQSPKAVPKTLSPIPDPVLPNFSQTPEPVPSSLTPVPEQQAKPATPQSLAHPKLTPTTVAASTVPKSVQVQNPEPGSGLAPVSPSPILDMCQHPGAEAVLVSCLDLGAVSAASDGQAGFGSGSESASCSGAGSRSDGSVLTFPAPAPSSSSSFCPAITIESESTVPPSPSPPSPSSPSSLPSPPAPALLLDPLTALHQSDKGGSSSGHTSTLSPSPRATQSPPKQTLFSPCVDVFEPGPASWEDGEEEQEEEDNDDDEDDDVGADESQYRHRRLTGDSGIEVCRCRVEEEDDDEEDEEVEEEEEKKGGGATDLHDSVDCPARGQVTTGEGLTLCNPASTATPTPEDPGEVVIVMETA